MASESAELLARLAKPRTLQQMVRAGDLVDTTLTSRWTGFTVDTYVSLAAFQELVDQSSPMPGATARNVSRLWERAAKATAAYKARGVILPRIVFPVPHPKSGRIVKVALVAHLDQGRPYVILTLECEA